MSAVIRESIPLLRCMQLADLSAVLKVELASYDFPWTEAIFRDCLRVGYYCCILEGGGGLVGHGVMSYAVGECHLLNICIHPHYQRRGLGRRMVQHLLGIGRRGGARVAFLEVRVSNRFAHDLYLRMGFSEIGIRKNYYPAGNGREDAVILVYDLENGEE